MTKNKLKEVKLALDNIFNLSMGNIHSKDIKQAILINYKVIYDYLNSLENQKSIVKRDKEVKEK